MTTLWPRLPLALAVGEYDALIEGAVGVSRSSHPAQVFTPVGGGRASEHDVKELVASLTACAVLHGFPEPASDSRRVAFDKDAAMVLSSRMDLTWSEGSSKDVWSFLALVALPEVTRWRFGLANRERWIATDITRHTWARLWWQAVIFAGDPGLLGQLSESDLNQLLERRRIGGDPRLATNLARAMVNVTPEGGNGRRRVAREATARLRRRLAYLDVRSMSDQQVRDLCVRLVEASLSSS